MKKYRHSGIKDTNKYRYNASVNDLSKIYCHIITRIEQDVKYKDSVWRTTVQQVKERIENMENEIKTQEQQIEDLKQELKKKDELIEAYSKVLKEEIK